jgi:hypothetical protein
MDPVGGSRQQHGPRFGNADGAALPGLSARRSNRWIPCCNANADHRSGVLEPNELCAALHNRMPVVLKPES